MSLVYAELAVACVMLARPARAGRDQDRAAAPAGCAARSADGIAAAFAELGCADATAMALSLAPCPRTG